MPLHILSFPPAKVNDTMTLIFLSLCFLIGIYVGSVEQISPLIALILGLVFTVAAIVGRRDGQVRLAALCLVAVTAGVLRYGMMVQPLGAGSIGEHVGPRPVEVGGVVVSEPDIRDQDIRLVVATYHIGTGQDSYPVSGAIQVRVPHYTTYQYGDDLLLKGVLQDPPDDETFSYKRYLLRQGIYAIMYNPTVEIVARGQGNHLLAALYSVKQRLQKALQTYLPEPQAGLAQGILLGVKAVITDDLRDDLQRTGLTHIIVVSGYNLVVVASIVQIVTQKRLRRSLALFLSLCAVILFTLMSGASVPVVRAAVMVSMALLARAVGRESDALTSLLFTAALLVGINPLTLWDVSFQLSFMATAGLILLGSQLESGLQRLPWGLGSILGPTLGATFMTMPVIAFNFHRISLISPLANVLVQPAIPLFMVTGAITAFAGLSGHVLVQSIGWLTWLQGTYMVQVMHILGQLPQASMDVPALSQQQQMVMIIAYFTVLAVLLAIVPQGTRADLYGLIRRGRDALQRAGWRLLMVGLAVAVAIVWLLVLIIIRQS